MLMPKKVKYRKQQRGRMCGKAWRGGELSFGDFGLKVMEPGWITDRQIEASRVATGRIARITLRWIGRWLRISRRKSFVPTAASRTSVSACISPAKPVSVRTEIAPIHVGAQKSLR